MQTTPMTTRLPLALQTKLNLIGPLLETQGVVQPHGRGRQTFRLRFRQFDPARGYSVHRSLSLGRDPRLAQEVAAHLVLLRQKPMETRLIAATEAACQRAAERTSRAEVRRLQRDRREAARALSIDPEAAMAQMLSRLNEISQAAHDRAYGPTQESERASPAPHRLVLECIPISAEGRYRARFPRVETTTASAWFSSRWLRLSS